jgi:hypothetical protein
MLKQFLRSAGFCAALGAACVPSAGLAVLALPPCAEADALLTDQLDTAQTEAGESFAFKLARDVPAADDVPALPQGTAGVGVVIYVQHARASGIPGVIVVEPRFVTLADGRRIAVESDPATEKTAIMAAKSGNAPSALEYLPLIGIAVSSYNLFHHGQELVLPAGTPFKILVGDSLAIGECSVGAAPRAR